MKIGVLHPGEMGVTVARAIVDAGHEACWVSSGRSGATAARAAGLRCFDALPELIAQVHAIVSVCPPGAAIEQAQQVAAAGFAGIYVDANAVAPGSAESIAAIFADKYVDGGIIGPPATKAGSTRLYLSGPLADDVAAWFDGSLLDALAIGDSPCAASALKMAYAAYTKGSSALLLAVNALAQRNGVAAALEAEWALSQPGLPQRSNAAARGTSRKAWRFVGEMQEIAATFGAAGLPDGFHRAAAEVYDRMSPLKDQPPAELEQVIAALLSEAEPR